MCFKFFYIVSLQCRTQFLQALTSTALLILCKKNLKNCWIFWKLQKLKHPLHLWFQLLSRFCTKKAEKLMEIAKTEASPAPLTSTALSILCKSWKTVESFGNCKNWSTPCTFDVNCSLDFVKKAEKLLNLLEIAKTKAPPAPLISTALSNLEKKAENLYWNSIKLKHPLHLWFQLLSRFCKKSWKTFWNSPKKLITPAGTATKRSITQRLCHLT